VPACPAACGVLPPGAVDDIGPLEAAGAAGDIPGAACTEGICAAWIDGPDGPSPACGDADCTVAPAFGEAAVAAFGDEGAAVVALGDTGADPTPFTGDGPTPPADDPTPPCM